MKNYYISILFLFLGSIQFSCTQDDTVIEEPSRKALPTSYAETFRLLWDVMDKRYNYFYEEKIRNGLDWDEVYREYYPKFAKLSTYGNKEANKELALQELRLAVDYFYEIINPLIDRHLNISISFNIPSLSNFPLKAFYRTGMTDKDVYKDFPYNYSVQEKTAVGRGQIRRVMETKIDRDINITDKDEKGNVTFSAYGGFLKSDPDVYYFSFGSFSLTNRDLIIGSAFEIKELTPSLVPTVSLFPLDVIKNEEVRNYATDFIDRFVATWIGTLGEIRSSEKYTSYKQAVAIFQETEKITPLKEASDELAIEFEHLFDTINEMLEEIILVQQNLALNPSIDQLDISNLGEVLNASRLFNLHRELSILHGLQSFFKTQEKINSAYELYRNFYNKLTDGTIKKLIVDFRGNRGGMALDLRTFVERVITEEKVYSYQRTKEGNGRFNYTPWVANTIAPHPFGIPQKIPIAILTNKISISMPEMSTMAIKSQGSHVISVGDYTRGGTAGLGDNDSMNGGYIGDVGNINFYMPLMATRDASKNVIEGIGVKPDIHILPTEEEIFGLGENPEIKDSVFEAALLEISKMN